MSHDFYQSPQSSIRPDSEHIILPSPFFVGFLLLAASVGVGLLLVLIEILMDKPLPGTNALPTILSSMLIGMHYGKKLGVLLPSKVRHLIILSNLFYNLILVLAVILIFPAALIESDLIQTIFSSPVFISVLAVILVIMYFLSYFIFKQGEKSGIKQREKMAAKR